MQTVVRGDCRAERAVQAVAQEDCRFRGADKKFTGRRPEPREGRSDRNHKRVIGGVHPPEERGREEPHRASPLRASGVIRSDKDTGGVSLRRHAGAHPA